MCVRACVRAHHLTKANYVAVNKCAQETASTPQLYLTYAHKSMYVTKHNRCYCQIDTIVIPMRNESCGCLEVYPISIEARNTYYTLPGYSCLCSRTTKNG